MRRPFGWAVATALLLTLIVVISPQLQDPAGKLTLRAKLDVGQPTSIEDYKSVVDSFFARSNRKVEYVGEMNEAEVVISTQATADATQITPSQSGKPVKLESNTIVTQKAPLYIAINRSHIDEESAAKIADVLSSNREANQTEVWTLKAVGDVILGRTVYVKMRNAGNYTLPFAKTADFLSNSDLTLANLEATLADGIDYPTEGTSFAAPTAAVDGLKLAGIDAVNLANNHSYNGGQTAFEAMMGSLKTNNLGYFGGGMNASEAHQPALIDIKGVKIALLGYSSIVGTAEAGQTSGSPTLSMAPWGPWDETKVQQMENDIRQAKSQADLVIIYYHWGAEYTHDANQHQRDVAHRAIDAGADLIIGTHPHWVQGIEWYKDRLITYSLGNFVFDQEWSLKTKQGTILSVSFNGTTLLEAKLTPIQIEDYHQPRLLDETSAKLILNDIYGHSWWPES